jgi:hypothetical protein
VVSAGAYFVFSGNPPRSPEEAIEAYIAALNDDDPRALARLAHRDVDASAQIEEKLDAFGGQNIQVTHVEVTVTGFGHAAEVDVTGHGDHGDYSESLHFSGDEFGEWHIDLGVMPPAGEEEGTEGP